PNSKNLPYTTLFRSTYNKAKQQSRQYAPKVAQALKNSNIDEAINISDRHKDSHLAMVVSSGLKEFKAHEGNTDISADEMEASKRDRKSTRLNSSHVS